MRRGGSGEWERPRAAPSGPLSSRTRLLRFRFPPWWGLRRPPPPMGGTLREWEKERSECDVLGLGADSAGCSLSVMVDR